MQLWQNLILTALGHLVVALVLLNIPLAVHRMPCSIRIRLFSRPVSLDRRNRTAVEEIPHLLPERERIDVLFLLDSGGSL